MNDKYLIEMARYHAEKAEWNTQQAKLHMRKMIDRMDEARNGQPWMSSAREWMNLHSWKNETHNRAAWMHRAESRRLLAEHKKMEAAA